ncbi:flagellar filament capping protein FliD [Legionella fallonii]|uniref:Flagellar hook-associated protein 2 n=1 Tax=Legionella fallonii LLAP-10 TaxID=1212491 RepID=A0A098G5C5_9GAMM|nr:flagellar filament capping protein FliD [Legionella fallonii]CEG56690.1 Flagellar hook associated protein 2 FliD [Legionella fallonii LLAP-10]
MGLSSPGIGSGLDVKAIVEALVKADITPAQSKHDKKLESVNTELSAVGQLKSSLSSLQETLHTLSDIDKFYTKKFTLSEQGYLTATLTNDAIKGTYQIAVQNLAQQQTLATGYFANDAMSIGSYGTMTINFGTYSSDNSTFTPNQDATSLTINISEDNNSLSAVCDAINNSNSGVIATVVDDSQGARLTLSSKETGEAYSMQISGDITALNYDPTTGVNSLTQTMAAQNSTILLNGLTISQNSNQLENVINGVTLNLTGATEGSTISMTIDDNQDQLTNLINEFVKKYNDTITFLTNLTGYNRETEQRGVFQGDPQFRKLKLNLTRWATAPLNNGNKSIQSLADLGIKTNKQGLLEINQDMFKQALSKNYNEIGALFAKTATATDSAISVQAVGNKVPAGTYAIDLTEFAPGVSMSGTIGPYAATSGDGQTLHGSDVLASLTLDVAGGSSGLRGNIIVTDGIAVLLDQLIDSYMDSKKGDLTQRNTSLDKEVDKLTKTQEKIDMRKEQVEKRYLRQFQALDLLISDLQSVSSALTQLMDTLPKLKVK